MPMIPVDAPDKATHTAAVVADWKLAKDELAGNYGKGDGKHTERGNKVDADNPR